MPLGLQLTAQEAAQLLVVIDDQQVGRGRAHGQRGSVANLLGGKLVPVVGATVLEQALEAFGSGDLAGAEALLNILWADNPASEVAALQGQVLRAAGRWADAIAWFERALEADPSDARPLIAIGQIQLQQGEVDAAQACFEQVVLQAGLALAFAPEQPLRLLELGLAYAELEKVDDATAALEEAVTADPALVEAHQTLASVLRTKGHLSEANAPSRRIGFTEGRSHCGPCEPG